MPAGDEYRAYAAECLELAQRATNEIDRASLLDMAQRWNSLAAQVDRQQPSRDR
jgi:hypothetical protein